MTWYQILGASALGSAIGLLAAIILGLILSKHEKGERILPYIPLVAALLAGGWLGGDYVAGHVFGLLAGQTELVYIYDAGLGITFVAFAGFFVLSWWLTRMM